MTTAGLDVAGPLEVPDVAWLPVSPRLATERRLTSVGWLIVIVALAGFLLLIDLSAWALVALAVGVLMQVWMFVVIGRAVRSWGYAEREHDLLVRHGILVRRLSVVPYGRLQFVDVSAGPVDRLFRLAAVQLHTAAAATDARIPGLEPAEASRLRDRLASFGADRSPGL
jgi:membrane protein YdbS with pleckstrin-like domain